MNDHHESPQFTKPPFLYEIRVKGQLSSPQWTEWFDDLTVTVAGGESILQGRVPDHAALYGLLGRLRDLAIPLVAVKVLDADAQVKLARQRRRYDLMITALLIVAYLLLLGGLAAITVLVAPIIHVALAMALLFALLGGLAHAFWLWSGQKHWRWVAYGAWAAAVITFVIYIPVSGKLPPTIGLAIAALIAAGGLIYAISFLRRRAESADAWLAGHAPARPHDDDSAD